MREHPGETTVGCRGPRRGPLLLLTVFAALAVGCTVRRSSAAAAGGADRCQLLDHTHGAWTALLERHVREGFVDYAAIKQESREALERYLADLAGVCRDHYASWSAPRKVAFWINAYNAYTVKLIVDHHPVKSIRSIGVLPLAAFRKDFIPMDKLRGKPISLNDLEHEILRKEFHEPRIHFGIVCASKSCPILRTEAYRADRLDGQLDASARDFLGEPSRNRYDAATNTLHLSAIFKWFREDFEKAKGSLPAFVSPYLGPELAGKLGSLKPRIEFLDYDWSLNGR